MAILTTVGIILLCLGYFVLIFVSLSSKPEQDEKKPRINPKQQTLCSSSVKNPPIQPLQDRNARIKSNG